MNRSLRDRALEALPEGVAILDGEGRIVDANGAFHLLLGLQRGQASGRQIGDLLTRMPVPGREAEVRGSMAASSGRFLAARHALEDGEDPPGSTLLVLRPSTSSERIELEREIFSDIARAVAVTDNLDELLRLIHESLRRVVYAENLFVALHDPETDTLSFPYFADLHDENPGAIPLGRSCTAWVLETGEPLLIGPEAFEELAAAGKVELVGAWSPSWMGVPLQSPNRTLGVLAIQHYEDEDAFSTRDLELCTSLAGHIAVAIERRLIDESLQRSRSVLASIVESMHDGVVVLDEGFRVLYFNRGMERITHTPREQVLERDQTLFEIFPFLIREGADERIRKAQQGEPQEIPELAFEMPDGTVGVSHDLYLPLRGPDGGPQRVLLLVRDVTEAVEARRNLERQETELQHSQKMEAVGRLAGGVAHDFNNLLTAINGFAELLLDDLGSDDPMRGPLGEIHAAGERAAALTQKLLALSRKQVAEAERTDLNGLLANFEPMLRRMIGASIDLAAELDEEPRWAFVDPLQIEQILLNLAVNASDAMPQGGRIVLRVVDRELDESAAAHPVEPGRYVGLEVEDDGAGMDEETQSRIFEPFFTTKEKGKGTGLGLAIVYGIVKGSRGYIWVDSEPGAGTTVRVYFPRVETPLEFPHGSPEVREETPTGSGTILLVEDEAPVRTLVKTILERAGYQVVEAAGARAALEAFAAWGGRFDLVVSDVVMPHTSGPDLVAKLRDLNRNLRVLYISGHLGQAVEGQGLLGRDTLLVKPFSAEQILERVAKALTR